MIFFVKKSKEIYGDNFTVYNVHSLLHLNEDVYYFQCSLNEMSCFPFENNLQRLNRFVRSTKSPLTEVCKRQAEFENSLVQRATKCRFTKNFFKHKRWMFPSP